MTGRHSIRRAAPCALAELETHESSNPPFLAGNTAGSLDSSRKLNGSETVVLWPKPTRCFAPPQFLSRYVDRHLQADRVLLSSLTRDMLRAALHQATGYCGVAGIESLRLIN
jgi:hypothetical protein